MKNAIFLLVGLAIGNLSFAEDASPSMDVINAWWSSKSNEKMTIYDHPLLPIFLKNHEIAYLLDVGFFGRGRNFEDQTVMVRPKLREVKEVGGSVRRDAVVHDLNHDGISEVETVSLGSGQGTTIGTRSIVQFDGWTPIVLHQAKFEDDEGAWGIKDYRYHARSVTWEFTDIDGDENDDLIEIITTKEGRNNREPIITHRTYKYVFKNNAFIRLIDNNKATKAKEKNG